MIDFNKCIINNFSNSLNFSYSSYKIIIDQLVILQDATLENGRQAISRNKRTQTVNNFNAWIIFLVLDSFSSFLSLLSFSIPLHPLHALRELKDLKRKTILNQVYCLTG